MEEYKQYKCIKEFEVNKYDDELTEEYLTVEKGSIWELDEYGGSIIGGDVHLDEADDSGTWLEISFETLEEYFEEVR